MTREELEEQLMQKKIKIFANMTDYEKELYDKCTSREDLNNLILSIYLSGEQSGIAIAQKTMEEVHNEL